VTQARADLDRASQLYENQNISKAEYDSTYAKSTSAQARLEQAVLTLERRDSDRAHGWDGHEEEHRGGTLVSPGITSFVLADTGGPCRLSACRRGRRNMKIGDALELHSEAMPGVDFSGNITRIAPSADPSSRVFDVECTIRNPDGS
jgi:multidrug resistance efflux pump